MMPEENRSGRRRGGRRRGRSASSPYAPAVAVSLTSQSTTRKAYAETRRWLLEQHGPVCAYCGKKGKAADMTLDHVTPRRGRTAYDRRDNLVLACQPCNGAKADKPILAFLLGRRERAKTFYRYGKHLSPMLVDLARQLAGPDADLHPAPAPQPEPARRVKTHWLDLDYPDDESPYKD